MYPDSTNPAADNNCKVNSTMDKPDDKINPVEQSSNIFNMPSYLTVSEEQNNDPQEVNFYECGKCIALQLELDRNKKISSCMKQKLMSSEQKLKLSKEKEEYCEELGVMTQNLEKIRCELKSKNMELENMCCSLEGKLSESLQEQIKLQQSLDFFTSELETCKTTRDEFRSQSEQLQKELIQYKSLTSQRKNFEEDLSALQKDIQKKEKKISKIQNISERNCITLSAKELQIKKMKSSQKILLKYFVQFGNKLDTANLTTKKEKRILTSYVETLEKSSTDDSVLWQDGSEETHVISDLENSPQKPIISNFSGNINGEQENLQNIQVELCSVGDFADEEIINIPVNFSPPRVNGNFKVENTCFDDFSDNTSFADRKNISIFQSSVSSQLEINTTSDAEMENLSGVEDSTYLSSSNIKIDPEVNSFEQNGLFNGEPVTSIADKSYVYKENEIATNSFADINHGARNKMMLTRPLNVENFGLPTSSNVRTNVSQNFLFKSYLKQPFAECQSNGDLPIFDDGLDISIGELNTLKEQICMNTEHFAPLSPLPPTPPPNNRSQQKMPIRNPAIRKALNLIDTQSYPETPSGFVVSASSSSAHTDSSTLNNNASFLSTSEQGNNISNFSHSPPKLYSAKKPSLCHQQSEGFEVQTDVQADIHKRQETNKQLNPPSASSGKAPHKFVVKRRYDGSINVYVNFMEGAVAEFEVDTGGGQMNILCRHPQSEDKEIMKQPSTFSPVVISNPSPVVNGITRQDAFHTPDHVGKDVSRCASASSTISAVADRLQPMYAQNAAPKSDCEPNAPNSKIRKLNSYAVKNSNSSDMFQPSASVEAQNSHPNLNWQQNSTNSKMRQLTSHTGKNPTIPFADDRFRPNTTTELQNSEPHSDCSQNAPGIKALKLTPSDFQVHASVPKTFVSSSDETSSAGEQQITQQSNNVLDTLCNIPKKTRQKKVKKQKKSTVVDSSLPSQEFQNIIDRPILQSDSITITPLPIAMADIKSLEKDAREVLIQSGIPKTTDRETKSGNEISPSPKTKQSKNVKQIQASVTNETDRKTRSKKGISSSPKTKQSNRKQIQTSIPKEPDGETKSENEPSPKTKQSKSKRIYKPRMQKLGTVPFIKFEPEGEDEQSLKDNANELCKQESVTIAFVKDKNEQNVNESAQTPIPTEHENEELKIESNSIPSDHLYHLSPDKSTARKMSLRCRKEAPNKVKKTVSFEKLPEVSNSRKRAKKTDIQERTTELGEMKDSISAQPQDFVSLDKPPEVPDQKKKSKKTDMKDTIREETEDEVLAQPQVASPFKKPLAVPTRKKRTKKADILQVITELEETEDEKVSESKTDESFFVQIPLSGSSSNLEEAMHEDEQVNINMGNSVPQMIESPASPTPSDNVYEPKLSTVQQVGYHPAITKNEMEFEPCAPQTRLPQSSKQPERVSEFTENSSISKNLNVVELSNEQIHLKGDVESIESKDRMLDEQQSFVNISQETIELLEASKHQFGSHKMEENIGYSSEDDMLVIAEDSVPFTNGISEANCEQTTNGLDSASANKAVAQQLVNGEKKKNYAALNGAPQPRTSIQRKPKSAKWGKHPKKLPTPEKVAPEEVVPLTPIESALETLDQLKFNDLHHRQYTHNLACVLLNPSNASTADETLLPIIKHLAASKRNPMIPYMTSKDPQELLPLIESCIVTCLFELAGKQKPHLAELLKTAVTALYSMIVTKKITVYGLASLCRVLTCLCKRMNDSKTPFNLCCTLLKLRHEFAPYLIASIGGVWPEILKSQDSENGEENILMEAFTYALFRKPKQLTETLWKQCTSVLNNVCGIFKIESFDLYDIMSKGLKLIMCGEFDDDNVEVEMELSTPLVIIAVNEGWVWFENEILPTYIKPAITELMHDNSKSSHRKLSLLCDIFVDISFTVEKDNNQPLIFWSSISSEIFTGDSDLAFPVQEALIIALIRLYMMKEITLTNVVSEWLNKNQKLICENKVRSLYKSKHWKSSSETDCIRIQDFNLEKI